MASASAPQVLNSWKEIAKYMGRGVRTVQRYERELHLPVRRLPGKAQGSVVAFRRDLDAWVRQELPSEPRLGAVQSPVGTDVLETHRQLVGSLKATSKC